MFNAELPTHSRFSAGMAKGGPQHSWDGFQHDYVITVRPIVWDILELYYSPAPSVKAKSTPILAPSVLKLLAELVHTHLYTAVNANADVVQTMPGLLDNGGTPRCPADSICPFEIKTDVSSATVTTETRPTNCAHVCFDLLVSVACARVTRQTLTTAVGCIVLFDYSNTSGTRTTTLLGGYSFHIASTIPSLTLPLVVMVLAAPVVVEAAAARQYRRTFRLASHLLTITMGRILAR